LVGALWETGVDYVFATLGTDHAPLIDALIRRGEEGEASPALVLCPHENLAVHMAAGFAVASGRCQAVLLHVDVGTASAGVGTHNLLRARLPALLLAGRAPQVDAALVAGGRDTYVHFIQDCFDQGALLRPFVKWEYALGHPDSARDVVHRALTVACSEPQGPVYLMLPREVLEAPTRATATPLPVPQRSPIKPARPSGATQEDLAGIALQLAAARNPMIVTGYAGRCAGTVRALAEIATLLGARVFEFAPSRMNFPRSSPCYAGENPAAYVSQADIGLLVDVDVPWIPGELTLPLEGEWFHLDVDVVKRGLPLWSFPVAARLEGSTEHMLDQLIHILRARMTSTQVESAQRRLRGLAEARRAEHDAAQASASSEAPTGSLTAAKVCRQLYRALPSSTVIVNEAVSLAATVRRELPFDEPGSMIGLAGGGLGFSGGMALGIKLAQPQRMVVRLVGDGAYQLGDPTGVLGLSRHLQLPFLTVVLDNGGWAAVGLAVKRMYPGRHNDDQLRFSTQVATIDDHALLARACGAYGESVDTPQAVDSAIQRCLATVQSGHSAVLHVRLCQ
jgi:acetolactate synthase-1/2/3 large subunit